MIKQAAAEFTNIINPGRMAYIIDIDNYGVDMDYKDLVNQAKHFAYVVIRGDEPFKQKDEVSKFLKKVVKENPNIIFDIFCKGTEKPVNITGVNYINYYVCLQLKRTNIPLDKRIKGNIITWFYQANANFVFDIKSDDDLDEIEMIASDYALPKSRIFVGPENSVKEYWTTIQSILRFVKIKGYNYFFNANKILEKVKGEYNG